MTETKLTPQKAEQAHRILEELANGDTTHAIVHHEADFFPAYLVTLTRAEASIKPSSDMGMCLNRDEIDHFLANKFYWPIKIRIARHIGNCPRCYRYFLDVEGKTFELPEEKEVDMQENMTPKEALAILMGLRNSDEKAHELLPDGQDLVVTLVQLSDIAAAETGQLAQITGDCQQAKNMEAFLAKELPLEEMAQYALHLIICIPCRIAISGRGIRPYQRSTEALRHALAGIQPDKEPVSG